MKSITADNYIVRPFPVHKTQTYSYTYLGGGNPTQVTIDLATVPPTGSTVWTWNGMGPEPTNPSGIGQRPLYASIEHLFYQSGSFWNMGGGFTPTDRAYVVSVAQTAYGEGITPGSVVITGTSPYKITDDGHGKLVTTDGNTVIGNVFYGLGIAVIQGAVSGSDISRFGMALTTGSALSVVFDATHTIYEHQVICTMEPSEHNYSVNPTMTGTTLSGEAPLSLAASGSLPPYMTTVGLYNDNNELVAIAKFPQPLKRAENGQQTVIIRFDA